MTPYGTARLWTIRRAAIEIKRRSGERQAVGEELRTAQKGGGGQRKLREQQRRIGLTQRRQGAKERKKKEQQSKQCQAASLLGFIKITKARNHETSRIQPLRDRVIH
jgi:hypothetical protein